jgi:nitrogen regulatory protein P-II 1
MLYREPCLNEGQFRYTSFRRKNGKRAKRKTYNKERMKKIEAIIRRIKFEDVKEALLDADIEWFSYYDVRGIGKSRQGRIYRGVVYDTSSIERILISVVVRDRNVEKTVDAILKASQTGEIGDGRIFVIPIQDAVRIRTGERGDIALYNAELEK